MPTTATPCSHFQGVQQIPCTCRGGPCLRQVAFLTDKCTHACQSHHARYHNFKQFTAASWLLQRSLHDAFCAVPIDLNITQRTIL